MPTPGFTPEEELQIWKDIAARRDDEIMKLEAKLKAAAPPPKPEPPPKPAPPPPPRPSSAKAFDGLPAEERARVREAYPHIEAEFDQAFMRENALRNPRDDRRTTAQILQDLDTKPATFDAKQFDPPGVSAQNYRARMSADYERGQALLASLPDGDPRKAALISLNSGIGVGRAAPARPAVPVRPVVHGSGPSGGGKSRQLGGARK